MKKIDEQIRLEDVSEEYKAFVEKFKPKKTTDDCYTPENIYEAVKGWACEEYGIDPERVVRPFWPGEDYERYPYTEESVVIDNPPFSIVGQICKYYNAREIPYFLFAPYLTNFNSQANHVISDESITYQNGADVPTAFLTNMGEWFVRSAPELNRLIKRENDKNRKVGKKELPKYTYPYEVLTASMVGYLSKHGVDFRLKKEDCFFTKGLDNQKPLGKAIFGGGFLISERAAAERAAAERAAATKWQLSEKEWGIVKSLGGESCGQEKSE